MAFGIDCEHHQRSLHVKESTSSRQLGFHRKDDCAQLSGNHTDAGTMASRWVADAKTFVHLQYRHTTFVIVLTKVHPHGVCRIGFDIDGSCIAYIGVLGLFVAANGMPATTQITKVPFTLTEFLHHRVGLWLLEIHLTLFRIDSSDVLRACIADLGYRDCLTGWDQCIAMLRSILTIALDG